MRKGPRLTWYASSDQEPAGWLQLIREIPRLQKYCDSFALHGLMAEAMAMVPLEVGVGRQSSTSSSCKVSHRPRMLAVRAASASIAR